MIIPKKLKAGDKIGILSTARKITIDELEPAIHILESWGLEVIFSGNLFEENNQFSGTIKQRAADLQKMIDDDNIKAVLCAKGGYGTVQIIDTINFSNLKGSPKWIIGYSDITVLHSHLHNLGFASIHATMPINFNTNTNQSLQSFQNCLFGKKNNTEYSSREFNKNGDVKAEIVGGNLSVLCSLIGSESDVNTDGKILFIEDLDEYLYHVDRMMMTLKRNGKFEHLKGLIVGEMSDMNDNAIPFGKTAEQIIFDYTKEYNFPICFGFPAGHLDDNRAIVFGKKTQLTIDTEKVILSCNLSSKS
jgi:muramoyltetrapeptide carboxypeptidase